MAFNVFKKIYVAPDYAYDVAHNRWVFSADRDDDYLADSLNDPGFETSVAGGATNISEIIGTEDGQYASEAHFLKHLYDTDWKGRIYCDADSYIKLFLAWTKIAFPNRTLDSCFKIYNIIKQRESLVFANEHASSWLVPRLDDKEQDVVLNKTQFTTAYNDFDTADTNPQSYYDTVRAEVKDELSIEVHMASYLSGRDTECLSVLSEKARKILSKDIFGVLDQIKCYIRDNIMTDKVRLMTGVTLGWEDQDWEGTLRAQSSDMDFLFGSTLERIIADNDFRFQSQEVARSWMQWLVDNTTAEDRDDIILGDIIKGAQYFLDYWDMNTDIDADRNAVYTTVIDEDIAYQGTTLTYGGDHMVDKINTFWLEYTYQMKSANNVVALTEISHT
jgi:hypothetical protein